MYDLSILIPARNEEFVSRTVDGILKNRRGKTEVLVGMDGVWSEPGIEDHDDVTIVYYPESIGQRAMTNQLCKLSKSKWVMKVDAHCIFDEGFDVKMLEAAERSGEDATLAPVMTNLHAFDWVCPDGHRTYQGPKKPCKQCGKDVTRDVVWKVRSNTPHSTAYRFDINMHFQYMNDWKKKQVGDLVESMSLQGSCFMLTRQKYWELNICDEEFGSWGQQGVEVACKTWLSGGRVLINKNTWYSHLFRTQDGFNFPYPNLVNMDKLRAKTKNIFAGDNWPQATRKFQWLLDKFAPLPGWHNDQKDLNIGDMEIPDVDRKMVIFYTDNRLNLKIAKAVQGQLKKIGLPIISASLKPMTFGDKNVVINEPRGYRAYFKQIIAALETAQSEIVFFCEHDVLYHPSHFEFTPPTEDKFYYNQNVVRVEWGTGRAVSWDANQVAQLCCSRQLALDWYYKALAEYEKDPEHFHRKFEPQGVNDDQFETWRSKEPNIDIRHNNTLTKSKWSLDDFRDKRTAVNFKQVECPAWAKEYVQIT